MSHRRTVSAAVRLLGRAAGGWRSRHPAVEGDPRDSPPPPWDPTGTSALYTWCARNAAQTRPQYLWPLLHCTHAARALGIEKIAALEFGVAGGNGLLAMEDAGAISTSLAGTDVEIIGFDTGVGMPASTDPRDSPWLIEPHYFAMDEQALRARLRCAELVLGPVRETARRWSTSAHSPIGFIAFDLDYYSSTMDAFAVLEGDASRLLPRVLCYFDDLFGYGWTDFTGERAAIDEFNASHDNRKLAKLHGLRYELPHEDFHKAWHEKLYVFHVFDHPAYNTSEGAADPRWFEAHRLPPEA